MRAVDDAVHGSRGLLLRVKRLATHLGLSDQSITYRHLRPRAKRPIDDSLVFLMIGRAGADGQMRLTPLLKCFDIRWSRQGSDGLFSAMEKVTNELAQGVGAKPFFALDKLAAEWLRHCASARRLPDGRRSEAGCRG